MTKRSVIAPKEVASELFLIPDLPRTVLVKRWTRIYGQPPPKGLSRRMLQYAAAYKLQSQAFSGLKPAARRRLGRLAKTHKDGGPGSVGSKGLPLGSRLVREWHGRTHTVDVLENGFLFDGRHYGSLSQVARAITGARWSGPRFFGL